MEEMQVFRNEQFGDVRTIEENGKPLFCGSDVARALGYSNPNKAVNDHCRAITKRSTPVSGKEQKINFIPEGDVYRLIIRSNLPSADKFERWVFDEVLPTIRKTGAYGLTLPQDYPSALRALADSYERENALQEQNAALLPKANFADAVSNSVNLVPMAELSAYLYKNGVKIGRNKLMERLREEGFLYRDGYGHNLPTQKSKDLGLLDVKQGHYLNGSESIATTTTYVTGKGKEYFMRRFGAVKETSIGRHPHQH